MTLAIPLAEIDDSQSRQVGGKAVNLSRLIKAGHTVPRGLCITAEAYRQFTEQTGLTTRIDIEYHRLDLAEMRWEEIWDLALRIRNMFLRTAFPKALRNELVNAINGFVDSQPVAVRSSSPHEDSSESSFAGLHESFLNLRGIDDILKHVKLVWASLWSDGAILYRRELGMSPKDSSMAVVLQELVEGEVSGLVFSRSPNDHSQIMIESVYGLNEGLVDGTVMPDRWTVDRESGLVIRHVPADRTHCVSKASTGTELTPLTETQRERPPLANHEVEAVAAMAISIEDHFGKPQDVEWTIRTGDVVVLQTRPITTAVTQETTGEPWSEEDRRPWYLSLTRSFENLKTLRDKVEQTILPGMEKDALALDAIDLKRLSREQLVETITIRQERHAHWVDAYWRDCIPLAHGVRLFGQLYNDAMSPEDPYEFTHLLAGTGMDAVRRNNAMIGLAARLRQSPSLLAHLKAGHSTGETEQFLCHVHAFIDEYGDQTFKTVRFFRDRDSLVKVLMEMASREHDNSHDVSLTELPDDNEFIGAFPERQQDMARDVLDLARASYRLRDDDNIYMAKVEAQVRKAVDEAINRLEEEGIEIPRSSSADDVLHCLIHPDEQRPSATKEHVADEPVEAQTNSIVPRGLKTSDRDFVLRARQLLGQPAGPGIATGPARVITGVEDLFNLKAGEILVCDSIEPTMTFVVSLVGGIVERRGGMLIHGAIIAREYGIPCVTGVADATALISTGAMITVDGYLGIVTLTES